MGKFQKIFIPNFRFEIRSSVHPRRLLVKLWKTLLKVSSYLNLMQTTRRVTNTCASTMELPKLPWLESIAFQSTNQKKLKQLHKACIHKVYLCCCESECVCGTSFLSRWVSVATQMWNRHANSIWLCCKRETGVTRTKLVEKTDHRRQKLQKEENPDDSGSNIPLHHLINYWGSRNHRGS